MSAPEILIRPATAADKAALGRLGAELLRLHHAFDADRFMAPGPQSEEGYGRFLAAEHASDDVVVLVAERAGAIVGYVFAGVEPRSWKELRDRAGFIHDVLVVEDARGTGTGSVSWRRPRRGWSRAASRASCCGPRRRTAPRSASSSGSASAAR